MKNTDKVFEKIIVGCGSKGLHALYSTLKAHSQAEHSCLALEASSRIGGSPFLVSRLATEAHYDVSLYDVARTLPELKIWWERSWMHPSEVDWKDKDWAYVLPQWQTYFKPCLELKIKESIFESVKGHVLTESPVGELNFENGVWKIRSGEKIFLAQNLHWTLGLKAMQSCVGKKQAEEYLEKNPLFVEEARDAEGLFAAEYEGANEESLFVALPVRHDHKLYLSFVSLHHTKVETFTYLHSDILKHPKELSSFEKSLKRTLKHTLSASIPELGQASLGVINESKGQSLASPWRLKDTPEKAICFSHEDLSL